MKEIKLSISFSAGSVEKQVNEQGYTFGDKKVAMEAASTALSVLLWNDVISLQEKNELQVKLIKIMLKNLIPL